MYSPVNDEVRQDQALLGRQALECVHKVLGNLHSTQFKNHPKPRLAVLVLRHQIHVWKSCRSPESCVPVVEACSGELDGTHFPAELVSLPMHARFTPSPPILLCTCLRN